MRPPWIQVQTLHLTQVQTQPLHQILALILLVLQKSRVL